jgi:electron transfer flavoprotein alpha subunit
MNQRVFWVFSDQPEYYPELIAGAARLGGEVRAFVLGGQAAAERAVSLGAGKVFLLEKEERRMLEDWVPAMAAAIRAEGPALVLLGATKRGRAMAVKLGVALGAAVVNDISALSLGETLTVSRMVYGGLAFGQVEIGVQSGVFTVGLGVFEAESLPRAVAGEVVRLPRMDSEPHIACLERRPKAGSSVNLAVAKRVVSVGRGFKSQDELALARGLAAELDAEISCSRPIAEGANWLEMGRYVGVTGVKLKADLYLALGISGQIQHMVGVGGVRTIFAVNRDKNAPIFKHADYGLVGDIYTVVPALTRLLRDEAQGNG